MEKNRLFLITVFVFLITVAFNQFWNEQREYNLEFLPFHLKWSRNRNPGKGWEEGELRHIVGDCPDPDNV